MLGILGISLVLNLGLFINQKRANKRFQKEKTEIVEQYQLKLSKNLERQLELTTKIFVWSISGSMMRDNYDQVDLYLNQMMQEENNIAEILVTDKAGKIKVATNKRHENKNLTDIYDKTYLKAEEVTVIHDNTQFRVIAPILSLNNKIGTLILEYNANDLMTSDITSPKDTSIVK